MWNMLSAPFWLTRPMVSSREAVAERVVKVETILLIDFMILLFPQNSLKVDAWPCTSEVMSSIDWQLWSCLESGCFGNDMPVFFSYVSKADWKSSWKRVDPDWSPILQWEEWSLRKGTWFVVRRWQRDCEVWVVGLCEGHRLHGNPHHSMRLCCTILILGVHKYTTFSPFYFTHLNSFTKPLSVKLKNENGAVVFEIVKSAWSLSHWLSPLSCPVSISKKEPACTCTYYALLCLTGTCKAFVRKFFVRSVSQVNILQ